MTDAKVARDLVIRYRTEVWDRGDLDVVDELFDPQCLMARNDLTLRGTRALKDSIAEIQAGFPDLRIGVDLIEAAGASVVARWHAEGTHLGWFAGMQETGIPVAYWGISLYTVEDARITEAWSTSTFPTALEAIRAEAARRPPLGAT